MEENMPKSLNEIVLLNLLAERNLALAKQSIFIKNGEEVPKHFVDRLAEVEVAIRKHQEMMIEDSIREARK